MVLISSPNYEKAMKLVAVMLADWRDAENVLGIGTLNREKLEELERLLQPATDDR